MNHKTIFLGTETTGIDTERCGVYQIAGIIDIDNKTVEEFDISCSLFPGDILEAGALDKGEITIEEITAFQSPAKAFIELSRILKKHVDPFDPTDKFIALAYVADFDNRVLRRFFKKNKNDYFGSWFWHPFIDIFNLAAYIHQDHRHEFENFKLGTVAKYCGIDFKEEALHDAMYDVRIARELYYKLIS
jgi:DNA polymerase-3 subunit epsilon